MVMLFTIGKKSTVFMRLECLMMTIRHECKKLQVLVNIKKCRYLLLVVILFDYV